MNIDVTGAVLPAPSRHLPRSAVVLFEGREPGGLAHAFAAGLRANGVDVVLAARAEPIDFSAEWILGYGPSTWEGSLLPVARRLHAIPRDRRPFFFYWFIECIPNPAWPIVVAGKLSDARAALTRREFHGGSAEPLAWARYASAMRRGFRFEILGELRYFERLGLLGSLAVTSGSRANYLRRHGLDCAVVPIGYDPELHGTYLGLERDLDVVFVGDVRSRRRSRLLHSVADGLSTRGIELSVFTHLYGSERTEILNRAKIVLNLFRQPYDYFGLRFMFCAASKALMISEPVVDLEPFVPGVHFVAVEARMIAQTIEDYLANEPARLELVDRAHRLVTEEFTMTRAAGQLLAQSV